MSIGENWLAPQPTANIANAILTQAPERARVTIVAAMTLTLTRKLSNPRLTMHWLRLRVWTPTLTWLPWPA